VTEKQKKNKGRKAARTKATVTQHVQHEQQQVQLGAEPGWAGVTSSRQMACRSRTRRQWSLTENRRCCSWTSTGWACSGAPAARAAPVNTVTTGIYGFMSWVSKQILISTAHSGTFKVKIPGNTTICIKTTGWVTAGHPVLSRKTCHTYGTTRGRKWGGLAIPGPPGKWLLKDGHGGKVKELLRNKTSSVYPVLVQRCYITVEVGIVVQKWFQIAQTWHNVASNILLMPQLYLWPVHAGNNVKFDLVKQQHFLLNSTKLYKYFWESQIQLCCQCEMAKCGTCSTCCICVKSGIILWNDEKCN